MQEPTNVEAVAAFSSMILVFIVVTLLFLVPAIVVWWKLFKKAGRPGWAVIIPVYNNMVMAQIGQKPVWLGVVAGVASLVSQSMPDPLGQLLSLASLVILVVLVIAMAKQYDQGIGFWLLALFLPIVAVFMVNKVTYIGSSEPAGSSAVPPATPVQPAAPQA